MNAQTPVTTLFLALSRADDVLSRLEGRLTGHPLQKLWEQRTDCLEAHAGAWNRGELAPLEDVVLHDASMDRSLPTIGVTLAQAILRGRRRTFRTAPARLLTPSGLEILLARTGASTENDTDLAEKAKSHMEEVAINFDGRMVAYPIPGSLNRNDPSELFSYWLRASRDLQQSHPAVLAVAMLLDLWWRLEPSQSQDYAGALLLEAYCRLGGRVRHARLCLEMGARAVNAHPSQWRRDAPDARRIQVCLDIVRSGAQKGLDEFNRLVLAAQILQRTLADRRTTSKLPELVDLALRSPLITTDLVSRSLRVTPQAAGRLIDELGGSLVEITGRARYRAWRI